MVSRNRKYDTSSAKRYYEKMISMRLGYADLDTAKEVASAMLDNWKSIFVEIYNAFHNASHFQDLQTYASGSILGGVLVRYGNYFLENVLLTGRISYEAFKNKLRNQKIKEEQLAVLGAYYACASIDVPSVASYVAQTNPQLYTALKDLCPKISGDPVTVASANPGIFAHVEDALMTYKPITVSRSKFYYIYTQLGVTKESTQGTQGGIAEAPTVPAPYPQSPNMPVDKANEILARLNQFAYGR